jgi:chromosome segregation ATPase
MRDIRDDLQERVKLLKERIGATQSQFDKVMEQLKREHRGNVEDLKSDLDAVRMVIKTEDRLLGSVGPSAEPQSEPMPPQQPRWQQAQSPQQPTSGAMSALSARMEAMG